MKDLDWRTILLALTTLAGIGTSGGLMATRPDTGAVTHMAEALAESRADVVRSTCKYRHAKAEAIARGATLPTKRSEWDAICSPESDEASTAEPVELAEVR